MVYTTILTHVLGFPKAIFVSIQKEQPTWKKVRCFREIFTTCVICRELFGVVFHDINLMWVTCEDGE